MRTITRTALALSGAAALTLFAVVPANAADDEGQQIVVQVAGSPLTIATLDATQPAAPVASLATANATIPVTITDPRAGVADWNATVSATAFATTETTSEPDVIAALTASMVGATINYSSASTFAFVSEDIGNGSTATPAADFTLATTATALPVAASDSVSGNNTATWTASLGIVVPAGALASSYATVITHSVV